MRLERRVVLHRAGVLARRDVRVVGHHALDVDRRPQRRAVAVPRPRVAELAGHVAQQRPARDRAARLADGLLHDAGVAEVEEQRHQVGEPLVERQHVGVGGHRERRAQAVQQRVRGLVRDHVVRERREDHPLRHGEACRLLARAEEAEAQVAALPRVARVALAHAEGPDDQAHAAAAFRRVAGPGDVAAERAAERGVGQAADGVGHLRGELAVAGRRRVAAGHQQVGIVEVERQPAQRHRCAGGVDLEQRPDRPLVHFLVRHQHRRHPADAVRDRRIQRVDPQRPRQRGARLALEGPRQRLSLDAGADLEAGRCGRLGRLAGGGAAGFGHGMCGQPRGGATTSLSGDARRMCSSVDPFPAPAGTSTTRPSRVERQLARRGAGRSSAPPTSTVAEPSGCSVSASRGRRDSGIGPESGL